MNYVVLVKGVPDFSEGTVKFKEDNTLDRGSTPTVLNPNDHQALEAVLEAKVKHGGMVTAITMGPPNYKVILQEAMAREADVARLASDIKLGGADTLATAATLAAAIKKVGDVDIVFAGFKSADGETGQTGPQTAWKLGWPIVTHVTKLDIFPEERRAVAERFVYDEIETVEFPLPAIVVTDPGFVTDYRKASHRLAHKDERAATTERSERIDELFEAWNAEALAVDENLVGLRGSPTIVRKVEPIPIPPKEREAEILDGNNPIDIERAAKLIIEKLAVS